MSTAVDDSSVQYKAGGVRVRLIWQAQKLLDSCGLKFLEPSEAVTNQPGIKGERYPDEYRQNDWDNNGVRPINILKCGNGDGHNRDGMAFSWLHSKFQTQREDAT